jgi:Domain of unknown function (DUF4062)
MKVFLSSTYLDLREHRGTVVEALERLGQRVERMEIFGARPEEPLGACLSEVEECDLFVGIYAYRYGFVPAGSTISVTEGELRHAAQLSKPIFCFIVDEAYPWPPKHIEKGLGESKLETLKSDLGKALVRDTFTSPENLALKVATSVGRYISRVTERQVYTDLGREGFVGAALAEAVAILFVDVMRLLCVGFGNAIRASNIARYSEFVDIAEQHLGDLRSQLVRFASTLGSDLHERILHVERRLSWALGRLKRGPDRVMTWPEYSVAMLKISQQVHEFCTAVASEYYTQISATVDGVVDEIFSLYGRPPKQAPVDDLFQLRLTIQSALLEKRLMAGGTPIMTIRDDMDQQLGIQYFVIDRTLLRESV